MSAARDEILGRIRRALADVPVGEPDHHVVAPAAGAKPAPPGDADPAPPSDAVALFCDRVDDYRARVTRVSAGGVDAAVRAAAARHDATRVAVPEGLPDGWLPDGLDPIVDRPGAPLDPATLDEVDGVITGCALAIAETGTIVLEAGAAQGRRALTLVPDLHICVVAADQVVGSVPEAIEAIGATVRGHRRPVTLISGPSATSDIELDRVEGVHGPRRLEVIVVGR
jgi:L-lactate dehydrogenase complex protein LldG